MQIDTNEFTDKPIRIANDNTSVVIRNIDPSKELFRITSEGVMKVTVAAGDDNTKQFIDCVNNMLANTRNPNHLTRVEIVKEV